MKMEYVIEAKHAGVVQSISTSVGDIIQAGAAILILEKTSEVADSDSHYIRDESFSNDATVMRDDLLELQKIKSLIYDESRPEQVLKRHSKGMRTARENIEDLCDPGSFVEYGALAVAAMHTTHGLDELRRISPADGFIYGLATINSHLFPGTRSRCIVASYDYTVFAGTQGYHGHKNMTECFNWLKPDTCLW